MRCVYLHEVRGEGCVSIESLDPQEQARRRIYSVSLKLQSDLDDMGRRIYLLALSQKQRQQSSLAEFEEFQREMSALYTRMRTVASNIQRLSKPLADSRSGMSIAEVVAIESERSMPPIQKTLPQSPLARTLTESNFYSKQMFFDTSFDRVSFGLLESKPSQSDGTTSKPKPEESISPISLKLRSLRAGNSKGVESSS